MGVAHVGLVHRDPCECKVKGFRAVSSIERNVSNRRHLQGVRHGVVKLVMELHHVSQGCKQGELRDGGASVWASPCKFR